MFIRRFVDRRPVEIVVYKLNHFSIIVLKYYSIKTSLLQRLYDGSQIATYAYILYYTTFSRGYINVHISVYDVYCACVDLINATPSAF